MRGCVLRCGMLVWRGLMAGGLGLWGWVAFRRMLRFLCGGNGISRPSLPAMEDFQRGNRNFRAAGCFRAAAYFLALGYFLTPGLRGMRDHRDSQDFTIGFGLAATAVGLADDNRFGLPIFFCEIFDSPGDDQVLPRLGTGRKG